MRKQHVRTVWARLKEALQDANKPATQVYAARLAGVEQPSVSDWNKDDQYPSMETAVRLGKRLGVCVEWLLTERGPKRPGRPDDPVAQRLWDIWPHLTDDTRQHILGYATVSVADAGAIFPSPPADPEAPSPLEPDVP